MTVYKQLLNKWKDAQPNFCGMQTKISRYNVIKITNIVLLKVCTNKHTHICLWKLKMHMCFHPAISLSVWTEGEQQFNLSASDNGQKTQ